jgi:hypothetical protein
MGHGQVPDVGVWSSQHFRGIVGMTGPNKKSVKIRHVLTAQMGHGVSYLIVIND